MELKEQNQKIKLAMKKLAKNEQIIIQLVIVEGNSLRKTGKIIGVSAMTVQRRLKRALAQLRDLLTTGSVRLIRGSIHLLFQRVNRRIQGGKLTLNAIAPHRKHGVLALLMLTLHSCHVCGRGAAEWRKH
jgi:predicted DNA-binding protein (UPF0251 family)